MLSVREMQKIIRFISMLFLPPATKLGQGDIFSSVCQEFCSRGGVPGQVAPGQVHPQQVHPLGRYIPTPQAGTPPWAGTQPPRHVHPP